ncbi:hypothetical protein BJ912DRAFT_803771, partial [Pholiota molesta]
SYRDLAKPKEVWLGDERFILATGIGRIHLNLHIPGKESQLTILQDAYFVPKLRGNLISVSRLTQAGYFVEFAPGNTCEIVNTSRMVCGVGHLDDNLYILKATPVTPERAY